MDKMVMDKEVLVINRIQLASINRVPIQVHTMATQIIIKGKQGIRKCHLPNNSNRWIIASWKLPMDKVIRMHYNRASSLPDHNLLTLVIPKIYIFKIMLKPHWRTNQACNITSKRTELTLH